MANVAGAVRAPSGSSAASLSAPASLVPVPADSGSLDAGILVVGESSVSAPPDVAYVSAGVQTQGATARAAQDANNIAMTAVIQRIKALGIADADVRTNGVGVNPMYDRAPGQIAGYQAVNNVSVTVRDVRRAGEILDAAISAGANQSGGVQFGLKDDAPFRRQAIAEAVKAARERGEAIAAAAGVRISGIRSLVDESGSGGRGIEIMSARAAPAQSVPIEPGQLVVTARVRVVFTFQ